MIVLPLAPVDNRLPSPSVGITVVYLAAFSASQSSYFKTLQAFRARAPITASTGFGGIHFVDLLEQYARRNRLVLKHCSEGRPPCIQDGFRHPGPGQASRIHVTNEDRTMLLDEPGAEFVQEVFPAIGDLRLNRLHALFLFRPLRNGQRPLCAAIDALRYYLLTRGECGEVLSAVVELT